ncbi:MAG: hypothetical protein NTY19_30210 [Planctomycetota bacterium]|nr:hypothetical protein [Planctomycetota bacterium]
MPQKLWRAASSTCCSSGERDLGVAWRAVDQDVVWREERFEFAFGIIPGFRHEVVVMVLVEAVEAAGDDRFESVEKVANYGEEGKNENENPAMICGARRWPD